MNISFCQKVLAYAYSLGIGISQTNLLNKLYDLSLCRLTLKGDEGANNKLS
jgi:hypothetical protein